MKEYGGLAEAIIRCVGGAENILHVTNCMTRVRLEVSDQNLVDKEKIKAQKGVLGLLIDAQVQVIVGPAVAQKTATKISEILSETGKGVSNGTIGSDAQESKSNKELAKEIAAKNKQMIKSKQKESKMKTLLKTVSNIFIPLSPAFIGSGLIASIRSVVSACITNGILTESALLTQCTTMLKVIQAGVLSYLVIYVGVLAAKQFKTDLGLGGAVGATVLLTGVSAENPIMNIFTGEALKSGQGGVIGVIIAVWIMSKIHKKLNEIMPESISLVVTSFLTLVSSGLVSILVIMPIAGLVSDGILIIVTKLLEIGGVVAGFILAGIWLPMVMMGLHHFMTPIHIELINQTGVTVLLPILAMAGAGQVGAALAIWAKCRKNKPLIGIVKGGLPAGILGIGEPLIYGVTLPLGKPFITACLGAGAGGAFVASFGNIGATSQAVSGILMIPLIADNRGLIYAAGILIAYAVGFVITYFFGIPESAQKEAHDLEDLEVV